MAFRGVVTGNLGADPDLRFTGAGKAVCELRIAATAQRKDQQSGQWGDDGEQLWVRVPLWEKQAELAVETLRKGDRVSVEGTLVVRGFDRRDGSKGQAFEITGGRLLGVMPKRANMGGSRPAQAQPGSGAYDQAGNDPWQANTLPSEPPF